MVPARWLKLLRRALRSPPWYTHLPPSGSRDPPELAAPGAAGRHLGAPLVADGHVAPLLDLAWVRSARPATTTIVTSVIGSSTQVVSPTSGARYGLPVASSTT